MNAHLESRTDVTHGVSATTPDWSRERPRRFWDPSRKSLRHLRAYQTRRSRGWIARVVISKWNVLAHRFWSTIAGLDLPLNCTLGGGLLLPHPNGIVVHPNAEVGPNCLLFQQVTLGTGGPLSGAPRLGGHVDVGAGAKILGGVTIGEHARVGANAVVLQDVPPGATVVGIPARIIANGAKREGSQDSLTCSGSS